MATLDSSIVNIALPTLTKEMGPDLPRVKWVVISYLLGITALLLPFGRLSDQYGRKRVFRSGFLVFAFGSLLCGLASGLPSLVVARVIQAIGAAMLMANGPAIITSVFPINERGKALGNLSMVVSAGLILGPSLGGFLISLAGWRSIFIVNVPIGILGSFLVQHFLEDDQAAPKRVPFDWLGAILQSIFLVSFVMLFDPPDLAIGKAIPFSSYRLLFLFITFLVGVWFIRIESKVLTPIFDLSLLRDRTFWSGNLAAFLLFVAYSSVTVLMPFFMEGVLRLPAHRSGLLMTAVPIAILIVAPVAGRLSDRFGSKGLSFFGAMIGAITLFAMAGVLNAGLSESVSSGFLVLVLLLMGAALGLFQSPNNSAIMSSVEIEKLGVASAFLATVRNLGWVTGTGLSTTVFAWRYQVSDDFLSALHFTFACAGGFAVLSMGSALLKKKLPRTSDECADTGNEA